MTQEDKDLLLKDLCARLPYGVKVQHQREDYLDEIQTIEHISRQYGEIETESVLGFVDNFKPYLRPMSSMTEEEEKEFGKIFELELKAIEAPEGHTIVSAASSTFEIDFYNKHHFDYRGLIEEGLAIEVTKENNPYKD